MEAKGIAFAEHTPGGRLSNGSPSGIGSRTQYGAAITYDGITRYESPRRFDKPAAAARFARGLESKESNAA